VSTLRFQIDTEPRQGVRPVDPASAWPFRQRRKRDGHMDGRDPARTGLPAWRGPPLACWHSQARLNC